MTGTLSLPTVSAPVMGDSEIRAKMEAFFSVDICGEMDACVPGFLGEARVGAGAGALGRVKELAATLVFAEKGGDQARGRLVS